LRNLREGHGTALDEELTEAACGDPVLTGLLLRREHGLELVRVDETVPQEKGAERRPRVMGGFHDLLIGRARENLRRESGFVRAVVQRVADASVSVGGEVRSRCGRGLVVLLGIAAGDDAARAERLARKVARLRVFEGLDGRLDRSLLDVGGEALVVSQFTLIADSRLRKGTRPDFSKAARPEVAEPLYERFCEALRAEGVPVQTGVFGARMEVSLVNDGPVTIVLDM
jgi:D-tyrosyl-tRNA(Tyr) deacylase